MNGDDLMAHWPLVLGYVKQRMRGVDLAECEDIAGDTMGKALTRYQDQGNENGLRSWLLTVAQRACIDWYRRRALRTSVTLDVVDWMIGRLDAGSAQHDTVIDVQTALARLRPSDREIVWRVGVLGQTQTAATGLPKSTSCRRCRVATGRFSGVLA